MKGEERVCHVTEADRLGPQGLGVSEKCLHVRPPYGMGPRFREGLRPASAGMGFCHCARRFCAAEPMG